MATNTCLQEFLQQIAEAIRCKCGKTEVICAKDFASLIETIEPIYDEIELTGNNTYNVSDYKLAIVNVPGTEEYQQFINGTLKEVVIPDGTTKLRNGLMYNYPNTDSSHYVSIKIPASVTSIEQYSLSFNGPKYVYFGGSLLEWLNITKANGFIGNADLYINNTLVEQVTIPSDIGTKIPDFSLYGIKSIKSLVVSEGIEELGNATFYGLSNLEEVTLPSTLKIIGNTVFNTCSKLKQITIPANVESIGYQTFYNISSNFICYIEATTPPTIASNTFLKSYMKAFYVPVGTRDDYIIATNWSNFADYIYEPNQVILQVPSSLLNNENYTYSLDNGQTWNQFSSSTISLQNVMSIMFDNNSTENTLLLGTTEGGSEIGSISSATLQYDTLGDLTIYITVQ